MQFIKNAYFDKMNDNILHGFCKKFKFFKLVSRGESILSVTTETLNNSNFDNADFEQLCYLADVTQYESDLFHLPY